MIAKTLYVKGGTYTLATIKADYTMTRLVADDGKSLTDGKVTVDCIDIPTADMPKWSEVVKPPDPPDPMDAEVELPLVKAELDRYKQAVAEVTAINTSTALKTALVDAVNRLKAAVAPIAISEPIVKGL